MLHEEKKSTTSSYFIYAYSFSTVVIIHFFPNLTSLSVLLYEFTFLCITLLGSKECLGLDLQLPCELVSSLSLLVPFLTVLACRGFYLVLTLLIIINLHPFLFHNHVVNKIQSQFHKNWKALFVLVKVNNKQGT